MIKLCVNCKHGGGWKYGSYSCKIMTDKQGYKFKFWKWKTNCWPALKILERRGLKSLWELRE